MNDAIITLLTLALQVLNLALGPNMPIEVKEKAMTFADRTLIEITEILSREVLLSMKTSPTPSQTNTGVPVVPIIQEQPIAKEEIKPSFEVIANPGDQTTFIDKGKAVHGRMADITIKNRSEVDLVITGLNIEKLEFELQESSELIFVFRTESGRVLGETNYTPTSSITKMDIQDTTIKPDSSSLFRLTLINIDDIKRPLKFRLKFETKEFTIKEQIVEWK